MHEQRLRATPELQLGRLEDELVEGSLPRTEGGSGCISFTITDATYGEMLGEVWEMVHRVGLGPAFVFVALDQATAMSACMRGMRVVYFHSPFQRAHEQRGSVWSGPVGRRGRAAGTQGKGGKGGQGGEKEKEKEEEKDTEKEKGKGKGKGKGGQGHAPRDFDNTKHRVYEAKYGLAMVLAELEVSE